MFTRVALLSFVLVLLEKTLELAKSLSVDGVADFLTKIELSQYVDAFREEVIDGAMLLDVSQDMLLELGVQSPLHQMRIMELFPRELNGTTAKYSSIHVEKFLRVHKLEKYADILESNGIDGDMILHVKQDLMKEVLQEVGVKSALEIRRICAKFEEYVQMHF